MLQAHAFRLKPLLVIATVFLPCLQHVGSSQPRLAAVIDSYYILNGDTVARITVDDTGEIWSPQANLDKLELLSNDLAFHLPEESCMMERRTRMDLAGGKENVDESKHWFKEIHKEAGINHIHRKNMAVRPFCLFDFVIPHQNSSKTTIIRGEFCVPEHLTGGAAVGDYNSDGLMDIYFTVFDGPSRLYKNNGDGTFTDVTQDSGLGPSRYASAAGWVDVNQDGDLDLYVTTVADTRHYLYINYGGIFREEGLKRNCAMRFANKRKLAGMTPNFGDFDNDGFLDIYVTEWILHSVGKPSASRLLRNRGIRQPGYFDDVTDSVGVNMDGYRSGTPLNQGTHTFGASFTDFDEDGFPELLVTADYGDSKMFWSKHGTNFSECTWDCGLRGEQDAMGHAIGDWDNDGHLDWFSTAIHHNATDCSITGCVFGSGGNRLYRNRGNRQFDDATDQAGVREGGWGWGAAFIDFNNDAYLDVVMTNGVDFPSTTTDDKFQKQRMILWENLGRGHNGKTREVSSMFGLNGTGQGRGLLKFDYDDDGDEDIVVCNNLGAPEMYNNIGGNRNSWIRVRVVHRCIMFQNRLCDSYGARVQVITARNHTQTQEIGSSTHFMGQSERTAHFGLGRDDSNVTVQVRWPAVSREMTFTNVRPNTTLRVLHPKSGEASIQTVPFSRLKYCPTIKLTEIVKQPKGATATINPDGKTASFKINPGVNTRDISAFIFTYRASVYPPPGNVTLTSTADVYVSYSYNSTEGGINDSDCKDGRRIAPPQSITDQRRFDGVSNNKKHVMWGSNMEDLSRDINAAYGDGFALPSGACSAEQRGDKTCRFPDELSGYGSNRPSARNISNVLFAQVGPLISARRLNDLHAHFGQFIAHDTDFSSPLPRFEFQGTLNDVWLPISVPKGDVHFDIRSTGKEHLSFVRSTFNRCTGRAYRTPRQQLNKITPYIDGSGVYGDTKRRSDKLRTKKNGKMKLGPKGIIPSNSMGLANDNVVGRQASRLLVAGDTRANVQPGLIALHTLFVREHNRLCDEYIKSHHKASDEETFQYARRIVISELQAITFREYLPSLLGGTRHLPHYQGYKDDVNVAMTNTMATAAFRFGHSQVNTHIWRLNANGTTHEYGHIPVRDAYFVPERVEREGGIDPILRGAVAFAAQEIDLKMIDDMRNVLFPVGRHNGLDLAAMNIQRGRDHGLPDYNTVRKEAGQPGLKSFDTLIDDRSIARDLKALYGNVDNIDLWVGGLAEKHEQGSELGQTFRIVVTINFLRIRDGDRFWYERFLSEEEISLVHSLTLGKIIRLNTGFKDAPDDIFFSTKHCKQAKDYQCVPRDRPDPRTDTRRKRKKPGSVRTAERGTETLIGLAAAFGVLFVVAVSVLVILIHQKRQRLSKPTEMPGNCEMDTIQNKMAI